MSLLTFHQTHQTHFIEPQAWLDSKQEIINHSDYFHQLRPSSQTSSPILKQVTFYPIVLIIPNQPITSDHHSPSRSTSRSRSDSRSRRMRIAKKTLRSVISSTQTDDGLHEPIGSETIFLFLSNQCTSQSTHPSTSWVFQ